MYPFSFRMSPGFPGGISGKESACQCRRCKRHEFDAWVGKSLWRRKCNPLQYSCLGNPMDRGAWWASPPVVEESDEAEHTCPLALEGSTRRLSLQSLGHTLVACPHLAPREARERVFPSLQDDNELNIRALITDKGEMDITRGYRSAQIAWFSKAVVELSDAKSI